MTRGPDGDLEYVSLFGVGTGAACTIRLPELKTATHEEAADLVARIQRAVDEWSSARAGKSVYEHTGRKYDVG
jgi:hypothetical protein